MLKRVVITNYLGESMEYKIEGVQPDEDPSGFLITSIDGLGPVKANVNMMELATKDGGIFNSARLSTRNIVIQGLFTNVTSIEEARLLSYKYFPIKKKVTVLIETDIRTAQTEGYVESNEPTIFSEGCGCQISILCEEPYWDGGKIGYTFGDTVPLFKFKFGNESLDEPLIKISEEVDVESVRNIVYDGEAETGMEIAVELPSEDFMDTFSVTKLEILGENDNKISIDASKMAKQVPNTAQNGIVQNRLMFYLDESRYKLIAKYSKTYPKGIYSPLALFNNGELHLFYDENQSSSVDINKHMKWDFESMKWIELPDIPSQNSFYNTPLWAVSYKSSLIGGEETIFAYAMSANRLYYYDEVRNGWYYFDVAEPSSNITFIARMGIVHNGEIHAFGYNSRVGYRMVHCKLVESQIGAQWVQVEDLANIFPSDYDATSAKIVKANNKIHILGGGTYHEYAHYIWNGLEGSESEWIRNPNNLPVKYSCFGGLVCYKNCIFAFDYKTNNNNTSRVYVYGVDGEWYYSHSVPIYVNSGKSVVADSDYIYLAPPTGDYNTGYYEEANNIKLIENDKLVINTNKGKKGVTLYRETNEYNIINALDKDSTWLQLHRGVNKFSYTAEGDSDKIQITISTNKWYEGV